MRITSLAIIVMLTISVQSRYQKVYQGAINDAKARAAKAGKARAANHLFIFIHHDAIKAAKAKAAKERAEKAANHLFLFMAGQTPF